MLVDHRKVITINKKSEEVFASYLDFYPEKICCISDSIFLFSSRDREASMLALYNSKTQKTVDEWFEYERRFSIPLYSHFYTSKTQTLYWQPCSNTIYSIDTTAKHTSKYFIDFNKYNYDEDNLIEVEFFGGMVPIDSKGSAQIRFAIETDKYLTVEFDCQQYSEDGWYIALYPKDGEDTMIIDSEKYLDDLLYTTYRVVPDFSTTIGNDYVGIIYPSYWKESVEKADYEGERFEWAKEYTSKLDDSMNPIIAIYHMK